jgi:drug/metabolite transporter (DMT)-like permease
MRAPGPATREVSPARRQLVVLVLLTLVWGFNWPIMKLGVSGLPGAPAAYPPLTFRALSLALGLPVLAAALVALKVPFAVPRRHWGELLQLAALNMMVWHAIVIVALQALSSGRAAILGYSMPIFAALWGRFVYGERLGVRSAFGVAAAALGVLLLLAHEFGRLSGAPWAALSMLAAAAIWAYGTHRLRRTTPGVPTLTIAFWMTAATTLSMTLLALAFEHERWQTPAPHVLLAIVYNALGVFGFAHAAWFYLARTLPPVASSISTMLIPVLGVFSGALALGETLHWQDFAAMLLIVAAIGSVFGAPIAGKGRESPAR